MAGEAVLRHDARTDFIRHEHGCEIDLLHRLDKRSNGALRVTVKYFFLGEFFFRHLAEYIAQVHRNTVEEQHIVGCARLTDRTLRAKRRFVRLP